MMMKRIRNFMFILLLMLLGASVLTGCSSKVDEGLEALENEKYEDAAASFEEAIEDEEDPGEAYRGLGLAYWELEEYDKAYEALKNAVKNSDEALGSTYNLLAAIALQKKEYKTALEYIDKAENCVGNSDELAQELTHNKIVCYEQLGKWDKAKEMMADYQAEYPEDESLAKDAEFLKTR